MSASYNASRILVCVVTPLVIILLSFSSRRTSSVRTLEGSSANLRYRDAQEVVVVGQTRNLNNATLDLSDDASVILKPTDGSSSSSPSSIPSVQPSTRSPSQAPTVLPTSRLPVNEESSSASSTSDEYLDRIVPPMILQQYRVSAPIMTLWGISQLDLEAKHIWEEVTSIFFSQRIQSKFGSSHDLVNVVATAEIVDDTKVSSRNWFGRNRRTRTRSTRTTSFHQLLDFMQQDKEAHHFGRTLSSNSISDATNSTSTMDGLRISFTLDIQFRSIVENHDVGSYVQECIKTASDRTLYTLLLQDTQDSQLIQVEFVMVKILNDATIVTEKPPLNTIQPSSSPPFWNQSILGASIGGALVILVALFVIGVPLILIYRRYIDSRSSSAGSGLKKQSTAREVIDQVGTKESDWSSSSRSFDFYSGVSAIQDTATEEAVAQSPSKQQSQASKINGERDITESKRSSFDGGIQDQSDAGNDSISYDFKSLDLSRVSHVSQEGYRNDSFLVPDDIEAAEDTINEQERLLSIHEEESLDTTTNFDGSVSVDNISELIDISSAQVNDASIVRSSIATSPKSSKPPLKFATKNLSYQSYFTNESSMERMDQAEIIELSVPQGPLGLIVDTIRGDIPTVHSIQDDSILRDKVMTGDRLISVNNIDTTEMAAGNVSKLIASFKNADRTLVFVRKSGNGNAANSSIRST